MKKTNLFIVGAPKCGTTAWVEYLNTHPKIGFSSKKEPHYFSDDFSNFRWAKNISEYENLFSGIDSSVQYIAEASPMYLYSKNAATNIHTFNSDAKILVFLRTPVTFLQSYHQQLLNIHEENVDNLERAWELQEKRLLGKCIPSTCREPKFLQYSQVARFGSQLERYFSLFRQEQIMVVIFDEWNKYPRATYLEIMKFLQLEDDGRTEFNVVNKAKSERLAFIGKLLHRPPFWTMQMSLYMKKLLGIKRLHIASRLRKLNYRAIKAQQLNEKLLSEIYYELSEDKNRLEILLGRQLEAWD